VESEERRDLALEHLSYLAQALVEAGREQEGIATFARAAARREDSEDFAEEEADFSRSLVQRHRNDDALAFAQRALTELAGAERQLQADEALGVQALCKARRGDAAGAVADATTSLAAKEHFLGERSILIPLLARGEALLALRRAPDALVDLERALAIADATKGDLAIRADIRFATARALVETRRDPERAVALATRAGGELETAGLPDAANAARRWLARNGTASIAALAPNH
jgi:tetratricopeptide (TPR) repeat protein